MHAVMQSGTGISVLAAVHMDRVLGLMAVGAALLAGGWMCTLVLAIG